MTKQELIRQTAKAARVTQETAAAVISAALDAATDALLQGDAVTLRNFGTLERRQRKERRARSMATGEAITIPAQYTIAFVPAQTIKDQLNGKGGAE